MQIIPYQPIFFLTRGQITESIHNGAIAVVQATGEQIGCFGDVHQPVYLRSTAKPFQAIPLIERQGHIQFGLESKEVAIICSSHSGTDEHVKVICGFQKKLQISENDLMCGIHYPLHEETTNELRASRQLPTPNRHNCSGKHTGMLALSLLIGQNISELPYISRDHPIQKIILNTFAEMCDVSQKEVIIGIDGCSVPNFAVPLYNAAWAYARLCDPEKGLVQPQERVTACHTIIDAMRAYPGMVAGPSRFDTHLMEVGQGRFVAKGGAEGFQGIGILPGVLHPSSPGIGIALKIGDGDIRGKIRAAVAVEVLKQIGVLREEDLISLQEFGPSFDVENWRKIKVGEGKPLFKLQSTFSPQVNSWNSKNSPN